MSFGSNVFRGREPFNSGKNLHSVQNDNQLSLRLPAFGGRETQ